MGEVIINRKTNETDIQLTIDYDKSYNASIDTGLGFLDHMLNTFARYADIDFTIKAKGDLYVDSHHLIEDIGIVLGKSIRQRIDENTKIERFASNIIPMDDSLILLAVDLSGRSYFSYDVDIENNYVGNIEVENFKEFFMKMTYNAMINLHIKKLSGENAHHIIENIFKSLGLALKIALNVNDELLSTKGTIGG